MTLVTRQQATGRRITPFRAAYPALPGKVNQAAPAAAPADDVADDAAQLAARRIAELEEKLRLERAGHEKACEAARAEGREEGLKQATARDGERFELLRDAIERASAGCAATIEQRADLAVMIARAALQRVFGAHWQHAGMVEAVIRHDAQQLAAGSIVRVRVSADDFADAAALADLAAAHGIEIERDGQLESGACLFDCTLGIIDASIPIQAHAVDELLARLAPEAGGAA